MLRALALAAFVSFVPFNSIAGPGPVNFDTVFDLVQKKAAPKRTPTPVAPTPDAFEGRPSLDLLCVSAEVASQKIRQDELQLLFAARNDLGLDVVYVNPQTRNWAHLLQIPDGRVCVIAAGEGYRMEIPGFPA